MSRADKCEIKQWFNDPLTGEWRRDWRVISIDEALTLRVNDEIFCCKECHGRVQPHKASEDGMGAHFEHEQRHSGCSLSDAYIEDTPRSRHPRAIEF